MPAIDGDGLASSQSVACAVLKDFSKAIQIDFDGGTDIVRLPLGGSMEDIGAIYMWPSLVCAVSDFSHLRHLLCGLSQSRGRKVLRL